MLYSGTDPESYITDYTLVHEGNRWAVGWGSSCQGLGSDCLGRARSQNSRSLNPDRQLREGWGDFAV